MHGKSCYFSSGMRGNYFSSSNLKAKIRSISTRIASFMFFFLANSIGLTEKSSRISISRAYGVENLATRPKIVTYVWPNSIWGRIKMIGINKLNPLVEINMVR